MSEKKQKIEPPKPEAFKAVQLSIFQNLLCNTPQERESLSNTIELWDAIPKYHVSRQRQTKLRQDGIFLPALKQDFLHRSKELTVVIRPARVSIGEKEVEFYPSAREELVEDALRKIACDRGKGYYESSERSGVAFTLYGLRKELKKRGHTLSYAEVLESLFVLKRSSIELRDAEGKVVTESTILVSLIGVSKEDISKDPKARWYADFSLMVSGSIKQLAYRQYDYGLMMSHKSQLARWLHKRMAHNYVQASLQQPYSITMTAIERDSGLLDAKRTNDNKLAIAKALTELKDDKVLFDYNLEETRGSRNKIVEIKFVLFPHHHFVSRVKAANKRTEIIGKR